MTIISGALDKMLSTTFNASGEARISAVPDRARESWRVRRYQCHTTSTKGTILTVYRISENAGSRIDYTQRGNDDVSEQVEPIPVEHGRPLVFVWTGGTVGARAEITLIGDKVFPT